MRFVLDIITTPNGRYEGHHTILGNAGRRDFTGILELLAILEQELQFSADRNADHTEHVIEHNVNIDGYAP